jgi:ribosomal protein S18 acetylase RimI-like enzyme
MAEGVLMKVRPLWEGDRARLHSILISTRAFTEAEIDVAMELIDIVLKNPSQGDYKIQCTVDDLNRPTGYICYGPVPMTENTFDLYWVAVAPEFQGKGIGSKLIEVLEERVRILGGRMILADTSSIAAYEKTRTFYQRTGFREVARIPDYYSPGNDRITYCKRLKIEG